MRSAKIYFQDRLAGILLEEDDGYRFVYDDEYLQQTDAQAISLTMPLSQKEYTARSMFPFFDGLIPEGWLLDVSIANWKLNRNDRMGLLMKCCRDCIGAVSVEPNNE